MVKKGPNSKNKVIISIKNLKKDYHLGNTVVQALKDVNLEIKSGEFSILFGPSGSGKTTLLNLLGLIDVPTCGTIVLDGHDTVSLNRIRRAEFRLNNIGFIFQKYYLLDELTALENVFLPAIAKEGYSSQLLAKAKSMLELVGLKERMRHRPAYLSEGEKQRVAVARSLINSPAILLCDEPTASLDADNGRVILDLLAKINKESSATVFLVTHDDRQLKYGDKVIHIADGMVQKGE
ncbi:MAG: ABC transporter ATP-binding protein [Candidatus Omnitrophica bacterium]|jgi:putative ABC transport system ATP-binding protein|nr:ABC transporter ATP-binding protein [Candidatus Omnitrophota bacterium]